MRMILRRLRRSRFRRVSAIGKRLQFYRATITFWRHV